MNVAEFPRRFSTIRAEVLYDLDEEGEENPNFHGLFSLTELSAAKVVSNSSLLPDGCVLPQPIQDLLWTSAVKYNRNLAIFRLLNTWKRQTVFLRPPCAFRTWRLFYWSNQDILEQISKLQCLAIAIIHNVMTTLPKHLGIRRTIRFIDLSEIPISDDVLRIICSCTSDFRKVYRSLPPCLSQKCKEDKQKLMKCSCISCNKLYIKLNCIIKHGSILQDLCEAWIFSKSKDSPVELVISALRIMPEAFCETTLSLVTVLDPSLIEIFNCSFCHIPSPMHYALYDRLKDFQNLKTLDLTYIALDGVRNPNMVAILGRILQMLVHLEQLHMSFSRITGCLHLLLDRLHVDSANAGEIVPSKLKHLGVYCCFLSRSDYLYLSQSHHAKSLYNLEISGNGVTVQSLETLFTACENLRVLEMESCRFSGDQDSAAQIFQALSKLQKLKFLNIAHFEGIGMDHLISNAKCIGQMSSLQCVKVSHPDCRNGCFMFPRHSPEIETQYTNKLVLALKELGYGSKNVKVII